MAVTLLDKDSFEAETKDSLVLVDFFAEWCGPCKQIAPLLEELSDEMDTPKFAKIDADENQDLAGKFGIMSIPCMLMLKNGEEVDRIVGALPKDKLKAKIEELVAKA